MTAILFVKRRFQVGHPSPRLKNEIASDAVRRGFTSQGASSPLMRVMNQALPVGLGTIGDRRGRASATAWDVRPAASVRAGVNGRWLGPSNNTRAAPARRGGGSRPLPPAAAARPELKCKFGQQELGFLSTASLKANVVHRGAPLHRPGQLAPPLHGAEMALLTGRWAAAGAQRGGARGRRWRRRGGCLFRGAASHC